MARQYKNARKAQKLMAKDAAAKLDVSPSTLGAWEAERKTPSIESLEAMADLYKVSTDYLLGRGNPSTVTSLPLSLDLLKIYHGKSVWSSDFGWVLVDSVKNVVVRLDGSTVPFDNAGSVYAAQPPFYEAALPDTKPLNKNWATTMRYGLNRSLTMQSSESSCAELIAFTNIGLKTTTETDSQLIPTGLNG